MHESRVRHYLKMAIDLSREGMERGAGGPFGCVIVKGDVVLAHGYNRVTLDNDPTAHAEMVAIRKACQVLGSFQLEGCEVYCSCEPCPMCLGAIYWARPAGVFYANTQHDAAEIGFDDAFIYREINMEDAARSIPFAHVAVEEGRAVFAAWVDKGDKTLY